jgi:hypothetical protein
MLASRFADCRVHRDKYSWVDVGTKEQPSPHGLKQCRECRHNSEINLPPQYMRIYLQKTGVSLLIIYGIFCPRLYFRPVPEPFFELLYKGLLQ